jgi:septal ring factor EnvC (AmiA/AmiB activator)
MSRENRKAAAFMIAIWLLALPFLLSQQVEPQQDLSEFEKRLAKINREIEALRQKIAAEERKEASLLSELDKTTFTKTVIKNELTIYNLQMEKTSQELAALRNDIVALRERLGHERQAINKTLVTLYKYGKFGFFQLLLEADNMNALFTESKHLGLLAGYQQEIIAAFQSTLAELGAAETAQEAKRAEYEGLIKDADQKRQELEAQESKYRALIREIQRNKKTFEQALQEQTERAEQLQSLMNKLASQEIVLPFRFVPLYEKKGKLPWPMDGKIITRFGLERHPQFNTITMNNGIEIAPRQDARIVQSIHPGKVIYADYFQGYGNLLIVDHGLNFYSLYGHCAEFLVNKGDLVRGEQAIAIAGDSGSLKGLSLYFEIRSKIKPLDPLQWLKRR